MTAQELVWEPTEDADHRSCDMSGHFWAEVKAGLDGHWLFVIWDYQGNAMLRGDAESAEGAQAAVSGWNRWVVTAGRDPSQNWPDE